MNNRDELQDLWLSQTIQVPGSTTPRFGLMEDLTAPVDLPFTGVTKVFGILVLLSPAKFAVEELVRGRATTSLEVVGCWLSIVAAVAGTIAILRLRKALLDVPPDGSIEAYRTALAREFDRQVRSYRSKYVVFLLLTWGCAMVGGSEDLRASYVQGNVQWLSYAILLLHVVGLIWIYRKQRAVDRRSVRRILSGL